MAGNPFIGIAASDLATLKTAYLAALVALASNQSYTLNGRALTRANLSEVKATLGQLQAAIDDANGDTVTASRVSFTGL